MTPENRRKIVSVLFHDFRDNMLELGQSADDVVELGEEYLKDLALKTDAEINEQLQLLHIREKVEKQILSGQFKNNKYKD